MTESSKATRRSFLKGGALAAVPLAATSVCAAALAADGSQQRLSRLEAEAAIRSTHQSWLRQGNAARDFSGLEGVRSVSAHPAGAPDRLQIAADGASATGHYDCAVELESALPRDSTLAQMAHAQGHGTVRRVQRRLLSVAYARSADGWRIGRVSLT